MKYVRQFLIILLVTCAGEILHYLLPLPVPASIYGLVLMLVLLITHVIPLDAVEKTGDFLVEAMPVMFIPAGVGLLVSWTDLKNILVPVLVITPGVTLFVMIVTGKVSDLVLQTTGRKSETGTGNTGNVQGARVTSGENISNMRAVNGDDVSDNRAMEGNRDSVVTGQQTKMGGTE